MDSQECPRCKAANPPGNKFCGQCGASLDATFGKLTEYLDNNLTARLDAVLKERFRDKAVVETELSAAVAEKVFAWAKLFGLFIGVPLAAFGAYLAFFGIDVNQTLNGLQKQLSEIDKKSLQAKGLAEAVTRSQSQLKSLDDSLKKSQEHAVQLAQAADDLQKNIKMRSQLLDQLPQLAKSVDTLIEGTGASTLQMHRKQGNAIGIDISRFTPIKDWAKVRQAGVSFVYVKASQGTSRVEPTFPSNCRDARKAGILCGGYHFLTGDEVQTQADNFIRTLKQEATDLPPAVDFEPSSPGPPATLAQLKEFLGLVARGTGCTPVIYTPAVSAGSTTATSDTDLPKYALWVARYAQAPRVPAPWTNWTFWQFANGLSVNGLPAMDINAFNGGEAQLTEFAKRSCGPR